MDFPLLLKARCRQIRKSGQNPHSFRFDNFFNNENQILDSGLISALIAFVNTLGISQKDRLLSRISFYMLVTLVLWVTNHLIPDFEALEAQRWEDRGVARPYIAVPMSEMERILISESR
jgi:hypothetical protein